MLTLDKAIAFAVKELEEVRERNKKLGVHLSHCNFGDYVGCCKYGDDQCPALSDSWSWFGARIQQADNHIYKDRGESMTEEENKHYLKLLHFRT